VGVAWSGRFGDGVVGAEDFEGAGVACCSVKCRVSQIQLTFLYVDIVGRARLLSAKFDVEFMVLWFWKGIAEYRTVRAQRLCCKTAHVSCRSARDVCGEPLCVMGCEMAMVCDA
jgi:hypothetical protein